MSEIRKMEIGISYLLRGGVLLSGILLLVGLGLLWITGDTSCPSNVLSLNWILWGDPFLAPSHIIFLGFFTLIFTPLLRIFVSILMYIKLKDVTFSILTGIVFLILLASIVLGYG